MPLTVELIHDPDQGGFTARLPDIPAYGEGETEDAASDDLKRHSAAISKPSAWKRR